MMNLIVLHLSLFSYNIDLCVSFLTALTLLSTANTSPLLFYHSLTTKACGFFGGGGGARSKSVKGSESPREE